MQAQEEMMIIFETVCWVMLKIPEEREESGRELGQYSLVMTGQVN